MFKRTNKKGFTIVELVIVIAVIGILAAVLIPTFSNVIQSANDTAALEEAKNTLQSYVAYMGSKGSALPDGTVFVVDSTSNTPPTATVTNGYWYVYYAGTLHAVSAGEKFTQLENADDKIQVKIEGEDKDCDYILNVLDDNGEALTVTEQTVEYNLVFYVRCAEEVEFNDGGDAKIFAGTVKTGTAVATGGSGT